MKITVTEDDIKSGKKSSSSHCPIAIAVARATMRFDVWVYMGTVQIGKKAYALPEEACQFYRDFDSGFKVEPFSFEIPHEDEDSIRETPVENPKKDCS